MEIEVLTVAVSKQVLTITKSHTFRRPKSQYKPVTQLAVLLKRLRRQLQPQKGLKKLYSMLIVQSKAIHKLIRVLSQQQTAPLQQHKKLHKQVMQLQQQKQANKMQTVTN